MNLNSSILLGIVSRNRAGILPKAISSALAQDARNLRVAVVNDGSTDETRQLKDRFPGVRWIDWPQSRGLIEARNFLMRSAEEDYFVSLDDDAFFMEGDEISTALRYLESCAAVAAVGFDILSPDRCNSVPRTTAEPAAMFIGCGHMLRLADAREVGFYETSPGLYGGEEKDLCLRLMDASYRINLLPGVHVWHEKTLVAREQPAQHRSGVCNDMAMTIRRTPLAALPLALLSKLFRHFRFSRAHQLEDPFWEGLRLLWQSLPDVWRTRRPVRLTTLREFIRLTHS